MFCCFSLLSLFYLTILLQNLFTLPGLPAFCAPSHFLLSFQTDCHLPFVPCLSDNSLPSLSRPASRMEYTSEVCTLKGLVGTRRTLVWWKQNPCRWSVPCPPSTSNLWKGARSQPRVSCFRPSAMNIFTPIIFLSSVFDCIFYYLYLSSCLFLFVCHLWSRTLWFCCLNSVSLSVGMYLCPCYLYPVRSGGAGQASFVVCVELKSGAVTPDHWVKRGTALVMSLNK